MRVRGVWGAVIVAGWSAAAGAADAPRLTLFGGIDGAFDGLSLSSGFDAAFGHGAEGRGPVMRFTTASGFSRFRLHPALPDRVVETSFAVRSMTGWRESGRWGTATVFAGLAVETRRLSPAWPDRHAGMRMGPAFALDAWLTPMDKVAVHVFVSYATTFRAATLRFAPGYDVGGGLFVGPELAWSAHHDTLRARFGIHATGLRIGPHSLRLSGGYAFDRGGRAGPYGGIAFWRHY